MIGATVWDEIGVVAMAGHVLHQSGLDVGEKSNGSLVNYERT